MKFADVCSGVLRVRHVVVCHGLEWYCLMSRDVSLCIVACFGVLQCGMMWTSVVSCDGV